MTTYTIDNENSFIAFASAKEAKSKLDAERFSSTKELARLAEKWPAPRLVEIWNTLPGVTPVKKFTSRKKAVLRIWAAIQNLDPHVGEQRPLFVLAKIIQFEAPLRMLVVKIPKVVHFLIVRTEL